METENLTLFLDVAQRLSFTAVAEARGLNPSSVSRAIGQVERELGVRLFERSTRRMSLTEAGEAFRLRASGILDEFEQAREQARGLVARPMGRLRLTASTAFGERMIVPLVPRFRAAYPEVALDLILTDARLDLIEEGIDLAVRLGTGVGGDGIVSRLLTTRYRVCASPDYLEIAPPLHRPEDLAVHACLLFTLPTFRTEWSFRSRGAVAGTEDPLRVPIRGDIAVSSALSLRTCVLQGGGPALLADWLIRDDLAAGGLVDLFPDYEVTATDFDTAAWLLYPSRAFLPQKTRVMIDFLRRELT